MMTGALDNLDACPFCGGRCDYLVGHHSFADVKVQCNDCNAEGPLFDDGDEHDPILATVSKSAARERAIEHNKALARNHWNARAGQGLCLGQQFIILCDEGDATFVCTASSGDFEPIGARPALFAQKNVDKVLAFLIGYCWPASIHGPDGSREVTGHGTEAYAGKFRAVPVNIIMGEPK